MWALGSQSPIAAFWVASTHRLCGRNPAGRSVDLACDDMVRQRVRLGMTAHRLTTAFVTLIPWLFYGGKEGCSEFDTSMKTSYGRTFNDFWIQLCLGSRSIAVCEFLSYVMRAKSSCARYFRGTLNWLAAIIASYMVLADHPASAYIRQSVRCVLFLWQSRALGSIGTLLLCSVAHLHVL